MKTLISMMEPIGENYSAVLEEIAKMKEFATTRFGLDFHKNNYSEIDPNRENTHYGVFASRKYHIKSAYGFTDKTVSYREFEHEKDAIEEAKSRTEKNFDTHIRGIPIHGANNCPLTKGFIEDEQFKKIFIIAHEGFHNHCKINKLRLSLNLEEPIASWIGHKTAIGYLKEHNPEQIPLLEEMWEFYREEYKIVNHFREELEKLYIQWDRGRRHWNIYTKIDIENFRRDEIKKAQLILNKFKESEEESKVNNALLLCYENYATNFEVVESTLQGVTVKEYLSNPSKFNKQIADASHKAFVEREDRIDYKASIEIDNEVARQKEMAKC
jgi:predicted aminopeptidase